MCWWLASSRPQRSIKSITGRGIHQLFLRQQKTLPWISFSAGQSGSFLPTPVSWPGRAFCQAGICGKKKKEVDVVEGHRLYLAQRQHLEDQFFSSCTCCFLWLILKLEHLRLPSMPTKSKHADCDQYQTWIHDFLLTNKMVGGQPAGFPNPLAFGSGLDSVYSVQGWVADQRPSNNQTWFNLVLLSPLMSPNCPLPPLSKCILLRTFLLTEYTIDTALLLASIMRLVDNACD